MTTVIHAKNLGKKYTIGHQRQERSNGAGKEHPAKILSRITEPSAGPESGTPGIAMKDGAMTYCLLVGLTPGSLDSPQQLDTKDAKLYHMYKRRILP